MERLGVITNPNSRKNRRRPDRRERLQRIVGDRGIVIQTRTVEEIGPALAEFERTGVDCWVSDGGDGAFHWMVNSAFESAFESLPLLLPSNGGTIDFVAKAAGVRGRCEQILEELLGVCRGETEFTVTQIDTMIAEGTRIDGRPFHRVGFACAAGGTGQRFFEKYYQHDRPGASTILRVVLRSIGSLVLLKSGLRRWSGRLGTYAEEFYRPTHAMVSIDGKPVRARYHNALHGGSINVELGGVFHAFPLARELGILHFQAGRLPPMEMIRNIPRFHRGKRIKSPTLVECCGTRMDIEAIDEPLAPVLDGEMYHGIKQLTLRIGPSISIPAVRPRHLSG